MHAPRLLFKSAPWGKIIEGIKKDLRVGKINSSPSDLNEYTSQLLALVTNSLQKLVPKAKPCPYSKRWWNVNLTALRSKFSRQRNQARRFKGIRTTPIISRKRCSACQIWVSKSSKTDQKESLGDLSRWHRRYLASSQIFGIRKLWFCSYFKAEKR